MVTSDSPNRRLTLTAKVVMLLGIVAVPPMVALGMVAIDRNRAALTVDAQHAHRLLAELATSAIAAELNDTRNALEALGDVLLSEGLTDDTSRFALVGAQLKAWGHTRFITVYSPQGRSLGSVRLEGVTEVSSPTQLPDAFRVSHFATGAAVRRTVQGEVRWVLPVSSPVIRDGEERPSLWLYAEVDLGALNQRVGDLGEAPPLRDRAAIFVVDSQRQLVLAADPTHLGETMQNHGVFRAISGTPSFHSRLSLSTDFEEGGEPRLGALATLPDVGWAVIVQQRQAQAYQTLTTLKVAVVLAVALACLVSLVAGLLGARQLTRPLKSLVGATKAIGQRAFSRVDPEVSRRADEVGDLARAFDDMSGQLDASETRLLKEAVVRSALSRYLPADVVERVVKDPTVLKLGGEARVVTVLFADVVDFTKLSQTLPPETVVAVLNELFTFATEIIRQHHGIVDKFIGDCVMAVFGLPTEGPHDAQNALLAAEALKRWVETGNRRWKKKYGVEIRLAMGLHTGPVVAGNVGSEQRMEYTVIGDTVNLAARLEASAAPNQILVSEATRRAIGDDARLEALGLRSLRGRSEPTLVYEVRP